MSEEKPESPTSVRFSPEVKAALGRYADRVDRSRSWVIETAVKHYLRDRGMLPKDDQPTS
jgi:predicted transcriptional regulator